MAAALHVYVQLVLDGAKSGSLANVKGVQAEGMVSDGLDIILSSLASLRGTTAEQVQLYLSSKDGVKKSIPVLIRGALEPDRLLQNEVLGRLNPSGAGAGASFPMPLYLVAVVARAAGAGA